MGRKSLKDTRQKEIVKAFYAVAKKEGLEKSSIAKVADYMTINPSLVIHYFKSKQDLEVALIDYILERYLNIYKSNGKIDSQEKLLELIDKLFSRKWNRLFDDGVFYSCYAMVYRNKQFKEKFKELHDSLRTSLKESLFEAQKNNLIQEEDVEKLTQVIFALLEGAYYYLGLVGNKEEYALKVEYYKQQVQTLLHINS
ncbi:TetR/AcrR family transcriptional regulator [Maribellus luteus]|uniref:Biofilm operon icaADBC HTH-type negative transcriptional regulator IcaR n=1 Tax=Maribellus luteus TaxID=2305463 RepID=A0A399T7J7_9BACT|nr:TetR family transcriptional regulator C-terminal domain-containing protein [Maribellus luteus]RIJ50832.1 TetR/AcrR family transcriptional regulator [Maribellus luteus]